MTPTLSILICTIRSRQLLLGRLISILRPQIDAANRAAGALTGGTSEPAGEGTGGTVVELLIDEDDGQIPIGSKRQRLLQRATGDYVCFIDDDDTISNDYVSRLLTALDPSFVTGHLSLAKTGTPTNDKGNMTSDAAQRPVTNDAAKRRDCVGFRAAWYEDGRPVGECSYSIANAKRREILRGDSYAIERQPGHLTPVRRDLALATGFRAWNHGEDADFSIRLRPLLKTEVFVDQVLYFYWLRSREAREHEKVHPQRWQDDNFRIERSLAAALK